MIYGRDQLSSEGGRDNPPVPEESVIPNGTQVEKDETELLLTESRGGKKEETGCSNRKSIFWGMYSSPRS